MEPQLQPQVLRHIKLMFFDFNNNGSITEVFTITHALDLATPESLIDCFKRFLYVLDFIPDDVDIEDMFNNNMGSELGNIDVTKEEPAPIKKNIDVKKEVSNNNNIEKFLKQMNESPEFTKRIFELFLRDVNDGKI